MAAYQPAHSRIIRFVFPDPDEPMITEWRAKERAGTVRMGRHLWRMARMTGPITTWPPRVRRGTVPGAAARPRAARTWRRHCRVSNSIGAEAVIPARPVVMA